MKQYRMAFYIDLINLKDRIDNADIDMGNPGVGGTQYLFLLNVKHLNKQYGKNCALLLTDGNFEMKDNDIPLISVGNVENAIKFCEKNDISVLTINSNIIDRIPASVLKTNVSIMLWAHNTLTWKRQYMAAKIDSVKKVICVSESQYINMKDTPCYGKCTFISNVIPERFYVNALTTDYSENKVVYIGSIMPQKGVHNLLEIWKYVEKRCSNAQMYIIGGANVWNRNAELGSGGVADKYYDRIIVNRMKRLRKPQNVHFMGAMGWKDIEPLISDARVGIVNPSHYMRDETFCMSAIELGAYGLPIVSRDRGDGLVTTVKNNITGYLNRTNKQIANSIVQLLEDTDLCRKIGANAKIYSANYIVQNEVYKWLNIVGDIESVNGFQKKHIIISKDGLFLKFDFGLKCLYLIESGKAIDLFKKKLLRK